MGKGRIKGGHAAWIRTDKEVDFGEKDQVFSGDVILRMILWSEYYLAGWITNLGYKLANDFFGHAVGIGIGSIDGVDTKVPSSL